jgi:DNA-binding transcriptional regulator YiaG
VGVITNERQYRITNAELKRFEEGLAAQAAAGPGPDVHPRIHQAMLDAMASERDELRAQLARYDDLRSGRVAQRTSHSWRELPIALIEARIAARLTQRELAERLGVPEQQVQRWEANSYAGVAIERLQEIADALQLQVLETVTYAIPA